MKTVIAYALVVIGVTQFLGLLVGGLIAVPIGMLLPHGPVKVRVGPPLMEFFNGAAALACALALFWFLGVSISFVLPIIVAAWLTFYFFFRSPEEKSPWVGAIVGIFVCWAVYRIKFAP